jgi:NTP pyrophosphatase (non-canonical NTP hydrolase)
MDRREDTIQGLPCFAFGDEEWPGLAKLVEECGEVVQVVGKLMMTHGNPGHWSGDLRSQLVEEIGDVKAAIEFVEAHCLTVEEREALTTRKYEKLVKFLNWHADMDADPYPGKARPTQHQYRRTGWRIDYGAYRATRASPRAQSTLVSAIRRVSRLGSAANDGSALSRDA